MAFDKKTIAAIAVLAIGPTIEAAKDVIGWIWTQNTKQQETTTQGMSGLNAQMGTLSSQFGQLQAHFDDFKSTTDDKLGELRADVHELRNQVDTNNRMLNPQSRDAGQPQRRYRSESDLNANPDYSLNHRARQLRC